MFLFCLFGLRQEYILPQASHLRYSGVLDARRAKADLLFGLRQEYILPQASHLRYSSVLDARRAKARPPSRAALAALASPSVSLMADSSPTGEPIHIVLFLHKT